MERNYVIVTLCIEVKQCVEQNCASQRRAHVVQCVASLWTAISAHPISHGVPSVSGATFVLINRITLSRNEPVDVYATPGDCFRFVEHCSHHHRKLGADDSTRLDSGSGLAAA